MLPSLKYTLKVWQTAVFVAPVITIITQYTPTDSVNIAAMIWIYFSLFGMMFSIPSAFVLWLAVYILLAYKRLTPIYIKALLTAISIGLTWLPFVFFTHGSPLSGPDCYLPLIYALTIVAGIWFYKLEGATVIVGD